MERYGKRQLSAVGRHDDKLTYMHGGRVRASGTLTYASVYLATEEESSTLASLTEGGNSDMDFC